MVDFPRLPDLPSPADQPLESAGVWKRTWYEWLRIVDRVVRSFIPIIETLDSDITNLGPVIASKISAVNVQVFTSNDTYTPTSGTAYVVVEMVGGGGGGGGGDANPDSGSGGGGGEYRRGRFTAAQIGSSVSVTIGAAGTAGSGTTNGGTGGNTSFGALMTANGGAGGQDSAASTLVNGGAGGTGGSGGDVAIAGKAGEPAGQFPGSYGADGGDSVLGHGATKIQVASGASLNGNVGTGYGAGGGGGLCRSTTNADGGAGTAGICIVTEYIAA